MEREVGEARRPGRDSAANTIKVAVMVSLVCAVLVSAAAVMLKPLQDQNQDLYRQRIVLEVAGLYEPGVDVGERFNLVEPRLVDLASGEYVDTDGADAYDFVAAAKDPQQSVSIPEELDLADIGRRARYAPIYLVEHDGKIDQVILPVYGSGLWSTMYGYVSLEEDGRTIRGLRFYEHAETPGLGDQIDRDSWRDQWSEKVLFDETGAVAIEVIRGQVQSGPRAIYEIDGLSGATLTGRGVNNLMRYWMGPHGFGPYLERLTQNRYDEDADNG